jgi:signal transduction histidine kinase
MAKSQKVIIRYKAPTKAIPLINLDENKTRQVVMNILDNAIHYSQPPKGGGVVEVSLLHSGGSVSYIVKDNGIGVPRDQQSMLFTKMFRAKNAKDMRPDGTGLGLYMVKRVVEDQGGKVLFESKYGKGSLFGFKIPVHNHIEIDAKAQAKLKSQIN